MNYDIQCNLLSTLILSYEHTDLQRQRQLWSFAAWVAAWEWVWDRFWSGKMHSNGTLPLTLAARCVHALKLTSRYNKTCHMGTALCKHPSIRRQNLVYGRHRLWYTKVPLDTFSTIWFPIPWHHCCHWCRNALEYLDISRERILINFREISQWSSYGIYQYTYTNKSWLTSLSQQLFGKNSSVRRSRNEP